MYRGPSRGPCIGIIYTHPSRVGGIHPLFSPSDTSHKIKLSFPIFFYLNDMFFFQANVHLPTSVVPAGTCWSLLFC